MNLLMLIVSSLFTSRQRLLSTISPKSSTGFIIFSNILIQLRHVRHHFDPDLPERIGINRRLCTSPLSCHIINIHLKIQDQSLQRVRSMLPQVVHISSFVRHASIIRPKRMSGQHVSLFYIVKFTQGSQPASMLREADHDAE